MANKAKIPFAEQLAIRCQPYFDELKDSTVEETKNQLGDLYKGLSDALKYFEDALAEKAAEDMDKAFTDITTKIDKYLNERESNIQETLDDMSVNVAKLTDDMTEVKESIENPPEENEDEVEEDAEVVDADAVERKNVNVKDDLEEALDGKKGSDIFVEVSKDIKDIKKNVDKATKSKYKFKDFLHDAFMFLFMWLSTMNPERFKQGFSDFVDSVKEKFGEAKAKVLEIWENDIKPALVFIREVRDFLIGAKEAAQETQEGVEKADVPEAHVDEQGHLKKWEATGSMWEHAADVSEANPVFLTGMIMGQKASTPANERGASETDPDFVGPILHKKSVSVSESTNTQPIEGIDTPLVGPSNQSTEGMYGMDSPMLGQSSSQGGMYGTSQASTNISTTTNTKVVQVNSRQDAHNG